MKIKYNTPELELIVLNARFDVLALSDPEGAIGGGGNGANPNNPTEDPFAM